MGLIFQPGTDQAVSNKAAIDFERQARRLGLKEKRLEDFRFDPYGYVMFAYPWGQPGPGRLEQFSGPDKWQEEELREIGEEAKSRNFNGKDPVAPIRRTISSGHGIGKGAMAAWLTDWIMNTRTDAKGTITANTVKQLDTKTWATIQWWVKRSCYYDPVNKFTINNTWMRHVLYPESWYCSPQTCKEENAEAFAGQHNVTSTSFYIFDEASAIPDLVWDNADGGMTDGEPMMFAFGNPTRTTGKFWRIHWGADSKRWVHKSIDARTCAIPNKTEIANMIEDFGEDSDKVRVRVRGLPPKVDEKQFIEMDKITAAIKRQVLPLDDEPLVAGLDVSGGGQSMHVLRFRRGPDARTIPPIRLRGDVSREVVIAKVAEVLRDQNPKRKVAMLFIDAGFFGSPIAERLKTLGFTNVVEVNFAETDTLDNYYANMRAYMWGRTKDWLPNGAIDAFPQLEIDLAGPGFHINKSNKVVLESKEDMAKRGLLSPDEADALVLTFAQHVAPVKKPERAVLPSQLLGGGGGARSLGWMK